MLIYVFLTAAAIAVCCLAGALAGFRLENIPPRLEDSLTGAAAGIMLGAAVLGLVAPSLELGGSAAIFLTPLGVICGAAFLSALNLLGPRLTGMIGAGTLQPIGISTRAVAKFADCAEYSCAYDTQYKDFLPLIEEKQ